LAEIINLRLARKRKRREDAQSRAAENRAIHGQSAAEQSLRGRVRGLHDKRLDAHRRDATPERDEPSD
jgi:hypothetical protein